MSKAFAGITKYTNLKNQVYIKVVPRASDKSKREDIAVRAEVANLGKLQPDVG